MSSRRPAWVVELAEATRTRPRERWSAFAPPTDGSARRSAVLVLFGQNAGGPDVLLIRRAAGLRSHAGQVAFPGGAQDPADDGPVAAALREAREETGLDPTGVEVLGALPDLYVRPSRFAVTPVLAWWREPGAVTVADPAEVASVHRVPVAALLDPANRFSVRHPSGYVGPAFVVGDLLVWGFTGGLLSRLFADLGWERPWDVARLTPLPASVVGGL